VTAASWAFLGAGEFEPWHDDVDRRLLDGSAGPVLVAPTAAAHEGEATFDRWAAMGLAHFGRLGVEARVLPLRRREDAARDDIVAALDDASMIFFSGGNPWRLAETVRDTPFWGRLLERLGDGMAYAGCSAGVACLTERTFDSDTVDVADIIKPGLGTFRRLLFGPHWDTVDGWIPGTTAFITGLVGPGETLIGIDERTAMLGDGDTWDVAGEAAIHVFRDDAWTTYPAGSTFDLTLERAAV
jgi:cyanophycinase-like exopeptidase